MSVYEKDYFDNGKSQSTASIMSRFTIILEIIAPSLFKSTESYVKTRFESVDAL